VVDLELKALLFISFAFFAASVLLCSCFRDAYYPRWGGVTLLITASAFVTGNYFVVAGLLLVVALSIRGQYEADKIAAWLFMLPLLPVAWSYHVPMPGINFLLELNYPRLLALIFLVPLFLSALRKGVFRGKKNSVWFMDVLVLIYFLYVCLFEFRRESVTNTLRYITYDFLLIALPYTVMTRFIETKSDLFKVIRALMFSAILFASLAVVAELFKWNLYGALHSPYLIEFRLAGFSEFRSGILRVKATMFSPIVFGYFLLLGVSSLYAFKGYLNRKRRLVMVGLLLLLLLAILFTFSRGVWLAVMITALAIIYLRLPGKGIRQIFPVLLAVGAVGFYQFGGVTEGVDTYGTFDYRAALIDASRIAFEENPLFGSLAFRENPVFEALQQGGGFVDFVNSYLNITLDSGIVGLLLYLIIPVVLLVQIYRKLQIPSLYHDKIMKHTGIAFFAIITGTMVLLLTVSSITFIPIYYWVLIGLSSAWLRMANMSEVLQ